MASVEPLAGAGSPVGDSDGVSLATYRDPGGCTAAAPLAVGVAAGTESNAERTDGLGRAVSPDAALICGSAGSDGSPQAHCANPAAEANTNRPPVGNRTRRLRGFIDGFCIGNSQTLAERARRKGRAVQSLRSV
jgi:hypothetical protein